MQKIRLYAPLVFIASAIIALDQWTKALVRENIALGAPWLPQGLEWLGPYARIVNWYNTGAAFGSFQGYGWIFTSLAFVVAGLILYYYPKVEPEDGWMRVAMSMQLAGALGNVIDRLTQSGKVTDFISVGTFPVFNIADSSISLGVALLLLGAWWKEKKAPPAAANQTQPETETETETNA